MCFCIDDMGEKSSCISSKIYCLLVLFHYHSLLCSIYAKGAFIIYVNVYFAENYIRISVKNNTNGVLL